MGHLESLISQRDKCRDDERVLAKQIKSAREEIANKKRLDKKKENNVSYESYKKLMDENKRLRGMLALIPRLNGATYAAAAEEIGVSTNRAMDIINTELGFLRHDVKPND